MFKRLLVPVDGTQRSASVVPLAVQMALAFGCAVRIVRVVNVRAGERGMIAGAATTDELVVSEMYSAENYLRDIACRFEDYGIRTSIAARVGEPTKQILKAGEEFGCDIIVMSTRARRNIRRSLLGSVADAIVRDARVPVLLHRVPE